MSAKQKAKHITDSIAKTLTPEGSSLDAAPTSPDLLGAWEGGTQALKGANNWVSAKSRGSRTASTKNTPGIDYPSRIEAKHQKDYVAPLKIEESDNVPCSDCEFESSVHSSHEHEGVYSDVPTSTE
jgi:hypothetical protein